MYKQLGTDFRPRYEKNIFFPLFFTTSEIVNAVSTGSKHFGNNFKNHGLMK